MKNKAKAPGTNFFTRDETVKAYRSILASVLCILVGILVGFLIMLLSMAFNNSADPIQGLLAILKGPFNSTRYAQTTVGNMIFYAVPLIFTGLSVAVSYKTGLFNIGAAGQFYLGLTGALLVALNINTTGNRFLGVLVWLLALLVGMIFAALWGTIPGIFKAIFGINEVIACIMTNRIAANLTTLIFTLQPHLSNVAGGKSDYLITTAVTGNWTPDLGLGTLLGHGTIKCYLDIGIIFAIVIAILVWFLMNKTTLGYSMRGCGANRNAAKASGMNEKRNIILAMAISGALAGLGACFYYLNPGIEFKFASANEVLPAYGFNGIPAALLANSNPIGIIFSALFLRYISSTGTYLQKYGFNLYFADIIIAVIIYLAGFTRFLQEKFDFLHLKAEKKRTEKRLARLEKEDIETYDKYTYGDEKPRKTGVISENVEAKTQPGVAEIAPKIEEKSEEKTEYKYIKPGENGPELVEEKAEIKEPSTKEENRNLTKEDYRKIISEEFKVAIEEFLNENAKKGDNK